MNEKYIVSNEYLAQKGLDLNEYALDGTYIPAILDLGLDICVDRICKLDDDIKSENQIESYLDTDDDKRTKEDKLKAFYKLQYRVIYNLIFQNETEPVDSYVDSIIVFQLGLGKINGFQKGLFYKNN